VTQEQYERVTGTNPSWFCREGGGRAKVAGLDTRDFPVEDVSWHDAQDFCRALAALPEERAAGRVYRLPTEAEWEYACRGGPSPAAAAEPDGNFDSRLPGAARGDYLGRTAPVKVRRPNPLGLFDMQGNVWEWCADWYDRDSYRSPSAGVDPKGPEASPEHRRVVRGGAWSYDGKYCRAAARLRFAPEERIYNVGFRLVLVVGERPA
jgi:formylglycine-generating enzyme required for sulfatase activity